MPKPLSGFIFEGRPAARFPPAMEDVEIWGL
jgi:hypothetical protein